MAVPARWERSTVKWRSGDVGGCEGLVSGYKNESKENVEEL
jgi:hypothetical protein